MNISAPHSTTKQKAHDVIVAETTRLLSRFGSSKPELIHSSKDEVKYIFNTLDSEFKCLIKIGDKDLNIDIQIPTKFKIFEPKMNTEVRKWLTKTFGSNSKLN